MIKSRVFFRVYTRRRNISWTKICKNCSLFDIIIKWWFQFGKIIKIILFDNFFSYDRIFPSNLFGKNWKKKNLEMFECKKYPRRMLNAIHSWQLNKILLKYYYNCDCFIHWVKTILFWRWSCKISFYNYNCLQR